MASAHPPDAAPRLPSLLLAGWARSRGNDSPNVCPLTRSLARRANLLAESFRRVIFAQVRIAALVFLVLVHKLEHFLNARIVGAIHARAWELLSAMLVMEAAFGIAGLVAAPVHYACIKRELTEARLV